MEYYRYWQLEKSLREIVLKNKFSNKTIWNKIKKELTDNIDLFKDRREVSISEYDLERFKLKSDCFNFLKSGFFSIHNYEGYYKISEIKRINSFVGGKFEFEMLDGFKKEISEYDYKCLKLLLL